MNYYIKPTLAVLFFSMMVRMVAAQENQPTKEVPIKEAPMQETSVKQEASNPEQANTILTASDPIHGVSVGMAVNLFSLFGNYNTFMMSGNVVFNEQLGVEIGGGPVLQSEVWTRYMRDNQNTFAPHIGMFFDILGMDNAEKGIEQHQGYSLFGEFKYYVVPGRHQPFFGLGYSYLNSRYTTSYVVKMNQSQKYYRNVKQDYQSIVNTYYLMIGYRVTFAQEKLFLEVGVNFRRVYKEVSPEFDNLIGEVVTNEGFVKDIDKYPLPVSLDLKIGLKVFN
ncbi:hypothetical protein N6H18_13230 [Reichenbachiella agarivorans]|uniref:Outer membrane protein beta-barrel domain-containing protein n=1 Tax=Reichenbachiella agarivorans TaxID=2979464 RepID=A0ABY6CLB1_9BACT|nr:hypothetical protein [Reichenbachiella agarivorans]UXP31311.1 hypothetical protein N6H18_13230 [Reichenbachiella agarivorans]